MRLLLAFLVVFLFNSVKLFADRELVIFHTNDVHSYFTPTSRSIGYAKIATYIKQERAANPNVLYLDAGDTIHGSVMAILEKGQSTVDVLNEVGLDAMTPGNSDFYYGTDRLIELSKNANFDVISANILKGNTELFKPYVIKVLQNGVKVGIFGLTTPETIYKANPVHVKNLRFITPEIVAKEQVRKMKSQGVDVIIALTHLGISKRSKPENRATILANVEGIDIIIDGSSHSVLKGNTRLNNALIVQAGRHGAYLGKITLKIDDYNNKFISYKQYSVSDSLNVAEDENVKALIEKYTNSQKEILDNVIAQIDEDLIGDTDAVREGETSLGMVMADAIKEDARSDIAFVNAGGIRSSISAGDVRIRDIIRAIPLPNIVYKINLRGSDIKPILEMSARYLPAQSSGLLHTSGLRFDVDIAKPYGSRISNIQVNGQPLVESRVYSVALPDFLLSGGDGYKMLTGKETKGSYSTLSEAFFHYIKKTDISTYSFAPRMNVSASESTVVSEEKEGKEEDATTKEDKNS